MNDSLQAFSAETQLMITLAPPVPDDDEVARVAARARTLITRPRTYRRVAAVGAIAVVATAVVATARLATYAPVPQQVVPLRHGVASPDLSALAPAVPLAEALSKVGHDVALPAAEVAGPIENVVLDTTAPDAAGNPGLIVIYRSGVVLFVRGREFDWTPPRAIAADGSEAASSAALAPSTLEVRELAGRLIRIGGAPDRVMWNEGGLGYTLRGRANDVPVEELLAVLASIK